MNFASIYILFFSKKKKKKMKIMVSFIANILSSKTSEELIKMLFILHYNIVKFYIWLFKMAFTVNHCCLGFKLRSERKTLKSTPKK